MIRSLIALFFLLCLSISMAQPSSFNSYTKDVESSSIAVGGKRYIKASHYRVVEIDLNQLSAILENAPHRNGLKTGPAVEIQLPLPNGTLHKYRVMENSTMHPELAAKYPEIRTYDAYGMGKSDEFVKLDITPQGFHAMIMSPGKSPIFIDPLQRNDTQHYMVYSQKDFITSKSMKCGVVSQSKPWNAVHKTKHFIDFNTCELRTYRLALAATAQYTQFQGGTVPQALAAQVTTMNRVNGVYETDMAITMQIIPNNNLIIYTNPNNQPYTSGNPGLMIGQNQTNIDAVIGSTNYDIGHVVDAAGSGLASLGCVCNANFKARGVTGQANPVGDPFDIDYVAHEMGHQFSANHTQNNDCQRNDPTAVEPGSGSTIMGYAGICAPNVQANSGAYFHGISMQEMGEFITSPEHTCPIKNPILPAPVITSTNGFAVVPANTPFALTAKAVINNNSSIVTYDWEQMDNEVSQQPPVSTATGGPSFRSFLPTVSGVRYFPNLSELANNGPFTWEVLPSVSRTMNYRVSVRRNAFGGSCNSYTDVTLSTTTAAGPFLLTYPNAPGINWQAQTVRTVTWDVANTNAPPVNAALVDILLSTDGGLTFPNTVITGVPNNGAQEICVPNLGTSNARLMVKSSNGTFFNVSRVNFTINGVQPHPPELTEAERNPMHNTEAFIYYEGCIPLSGDVYRVNGVAGATIELDSRNNRFHVKGINTPKRVNVSITVISGNVNRTSNQITIPSIL